MSNSSSKNKTTRFDNSSSSVYHATKFVVSPSKLRLLNKSSQSLLPAGVASAKTESDHAYVSTEPDPMLPHKFGKQSQKTQMNFVVLPEETEINSIDYQSTNPNLLFRPDFSA